MTVSATSAAAVATLRVDSSPVPDVGELTPLLDAHAPLLWMRRGTGLAGQGAALRLEFSGESRFRDAATLWRQVVSRASVHDSVQVPGSGLVAFGAFAFDNASARRSVLIVPRVVVGRREGVSWITRISADGDDTPVATPSASPLGAEYRIRLAPGALDPAGYQRAVERAVALIAGRQLDKVVIARDLVGRLPHDADLRRLLLELARRYPDCWAYAVDGMIGASPETLVRVQRGSVSARVLAGTISRGRDAESDHDAAVALASSSKDQREHAFAVESVVAALRAHTDRLETSEMPFTLKLPNLWHLATDLDGTLNDRSTSLDLIAALHPTAAVAGTPSADAVAAIRELEPFDRGRYAGPVGWVDADGDGEWALALRGAQVDDDGTVTAFAGCGIVADSEPARELAETEMKFRPIVEGLG